jgi:ERCC4-type nuclease
MVVVDDRIGSRDLIEPLKALGVPCELSRLEFGDVMFLGVGASGEPVPIAVEVKTLNDLLSCVVSGRFLGHQLPGLLRDYDHVWLVVEGVYRANPADGALETRRGRDWHPVGHGRQRWMFRSLDKWLTKLEVRAGVKIRRTGSRDETARTISALYNWWQESDDHTLDDLDRSTQLALATKVANEGGGSGAWLGEKPKAAGIVRRIAAELPGIGVEKSGMVAGEFGTVQEMVLAPEPVWRSLPGIGKTLASRIVIAMTEENQ